MDRDVMAEQSMSIEPEEKKVMKYKITELEIDVEKVWDNLAFAQGCKPKQEDCSFKRCHSWGRCSQITISITKACPIKVKETP